MDTLKVRPPEGFLAKVVRTADRWRALDREATDACQTTARIVQANQLLRQGRAENALRLLEESVRAYPQAAAVHHALGRAWSQVNRLPAAEQALREAIRLQPDDAAAHADLGRTLLELDRPLTLGTSAKVALKRAMLVSRERPPRRPHIRSTGLLFGILQAELGTVPRTLAIAGVDRRALIARAGHQMDKATC